jgi:hypothetical protein
VLETRTAGDPDDAPLVFTARSPARLSVTMAKRGTPVGAEVMRHGLEEPDLRWRTMATDLAGGHSPDRETPCERRADLIAAYQEAGHPSCAIDTKAHAHLGKLFRAGRVRRTQALRACDPDVPRWADGGLMPHGMDDRVRHRGPINLGVSHDTSPCACDSFRGSGNRMGKRCDPEATSILGLCDGGGSHAASTDIFQHAVQPLADPIGVEMRVAHSPSSCAKDHVIARRLLPHITRACQGRWCDTLDTVVTLRRKAATSTGLRTTGNVMRRHDATGRHATDHMKQNLKIVFDHLLPKWHSRAIPQHATVID